MVADTKMKCCLMNKVSTILERHKMIRTMNEECSNDDEVTFVFCKI